MSKINYNISPLYKRLIAYLIDVSIHYSVTVVGGKLLFKLGWLELSIINFFVLIIYFVYFSNTSASQTIGQKCFMIRLEYYGSKRFKIWFTIPRAMMLASIANPILIPIIPAILLLFSFILLTQKQMRYKIQFIWDVVGKTVVVKCPG
jgi:hypothetical protein